MIIHAGRVLDFVFAEKIDALMADPLPQIGDKGAYNVTRQCLVLSLQRSLGLAVDGIIGDKTIAAIKASYLNGMKFETQINLSRAPHYFSQRSNHIHPETSCGLTSVAMMLSAHGVRASRKIRLADQLSSMVHEGKAEILTHAPKRVRNRNLHTLHEALMYAIAGCGLTPQRRYDIRPKELRDIIVSSGPIVMSGMFTGGGHMICVWGVTGDGDLIANDPWGNWNSGYHETNGAGVVYPWNRVRRIIRDSEENLFVIWAHE